jgi:hypothetical protein
MTGIEHEVVSTIPGISGVAGWIIGSLVSVIGVLSGVIVKQYVDAKAVNNHRLAERDTLMTVLNGVKTSQSESAAASRERNQMTAELARIISASTTQTETVHALMKMQFEFLKEDYSRLADIVTSIAEGVRNLAALNTDMKVSVIALAPMLQALQNALDQIRSRR